MELRNSSVQFGPKNWSALSGPSSVATSARFVLVLAMYADGSSHVSSGSHALGRLFVGARQL